jgi:hypothetical protein
MLEVGRGLTEEQARQKIKREFPVFLKSLHRSDMDNRQFLRLMLTPPSPEDKVEMLRKLRAMGHQLRLDDMDQIHELTFSFFDSLLPEIDEDHGSMSLALRSSIEPES